MAAIPMPQGLSEEAERLLREILRESGDGYTLMSRTNLRDQAKFAKAVDELMKQSLIEVKGDTSPDRVGESFFYVPIKAQGRANLFLSRYLTSM